jgi:hypothetical protein
MNIAHPSANNPQPACGIAATIPSCGTPLNPESASSRFIGVRDWPPLIKMDAAIKAKVGKLFNG